MHYLCKFALKLTAGLAAVAVVATALPNLTAPQPAKAATLATSFQLPCQPYSSPYYAFGQYVSGWGYHAGEDTCNAAGIPVYAAGNGRVVYSARTPDSYRWGNLILIEHQDATGGYATSLYGHLSNARMVAPGQDVVKGQLIGYTGPGWTAENGNWSAHLHFGMRPGGYGAGVGAYASWIRGYENNFPSGWMRPSTFINDRLAAYDFTPIDAAGGGPIFFTGQTDITFRVRNTGTQTWRRDGANPVRLGTVGPNDHVSSFSKNGTNAGWTQGGTRITMQADTAPGSIASFKATFTSNKQPGVYLPCFGVVSEGAFWMGGSAAVCVNLQVLPPSWRATYYTQMITTSHSPTDLSNQTSNQTLLPGQKRNIKIMFKNTGEEEWDSAPGLDQVRLGTYNPTDRPSPWATGGDGSIDPSENWPVYSRPSEIDGRYDPATNAVVPASVIKPGEIATFSFTITAPQQGGEYREYFNPVVEGRLWMPPTGVWFKLKVVEPGAHYEYVSQSQSVQNVTAAVSSIDTTLQLRNSGRDSWPVGGNFKLATDRPTDVPSPFYSPSGTDAWLSPTRVSAIDRNVSDPAKQTVESGEVAEFKFRVSVPPLPVGSHKLYLRPVIEGVQWLPEDYGIFFTVNVTAPAYAYQVTHQSFTTDPNYTQPNSTNTVTLAVKNTGRAAWKTSGPNAVKFGAARPNDRSSRFASLSGSDAWESPSRASTIDGKVTNLAALTSEPATEILPNETALFTIPLTANGSAGTWNEYFNLVAEGVTWLPDMGVFFPIRVTTQSAPAPLTSWSATGNEYTSCSGSCRHSHSQGIAYSYSTPFLPTYTSGNMAGGNYALKITYRNISGVLPPNYAYQVNLRVNGQTTPLLLPGNQTSFTVPSVSLAGATAMQLEWTNDYYVPGQYDANLAIAKVELTKLP